MEKTKKRDSAKAARVQKVANMAGVSIRQVYRVINGDQDNEDILSAYMELLEGENQLLVAVKELIPFNPKN
jgi:hypothetical protein